MRSRLSLLALLLLSFELQAAPVVTSISPISGPTAGGTSLTIKGSGFLTATSVNFGSSSVAPTIVDDNTITVNTPLYIPSAVDVRVTDGVTPSPIVRGDIFTFTGEWTEYIARQTSLGRLQSYALPSGALGASVTVGFIPSDVAVTPDRLFAVVPNDSDSTVSIVNLITNTVSSIVTMSGAFPNPRSVAISADGLTAYIGNGSSLGVNSIGKISMTSFTEILPPILIASTPTALAVTQDGKTLYVACAGSDSVLVIDLVTSTLLTTLSMPGISPFALAITPDQSTVYVVGTTGNTVRTIDTATNTVNPTPIIVGDGPRDIAISSDGTKAYVVNTGTNDMSIISLPTNTVTTAPLVFANIPIRVTLTPDNLNACVLVGDTVVFVNLTDFTFTTSSAVQPSNEVVSPDQAPVAIFTADTTTPTVQFDASASNSPVGTVVSYAWDFGDSVTFTTISPTTSHTYTADGNYNVRLTITNSAGTSTTQLFTGQTVSNNGNDFATILQTIQVTGVTPPPPPPSSIARPKKFKGHLHKIHHHFKLRSHWDKVTGAVSYQIFKGKEKVKTVQASKDRKYKQHLHPIEYYLEHQKKYKKRLHHKYKVRAVDGTGKKSSFRKLTF